MVASVKFLSKKIISRLCTESRDKLVNEHSDIYLKRIACLQTSVSKLTNANIEFCEQLSEAAEALRALSSFCHRGNLAFGWLSYLVAENAAGDRMALERTLSRYTARLETAGIGHDRTESQMLGLLDQFRRMSELAFDELYPDEESKYSTKNNPLI